MSQTTDLLGLLRLYGDIGVTPKDAIRDLSCYRLAARVSDLRADGYDVRTEMVTDYYGHRFARYTLHEGPEQLAVGL